MTRFKRKEHDVFNRELAMPASADQSKKAEQNYMAKTLADLQQMRKDSYKESVLAYTKAAEDRYASVDRAGASYIRSEFLKAEKPTITSIEQIRENKRVGERRA